MSLSVRESSGTPHLIGTRRGARTMIVVLLVVVAGAFGWWAPWAIRERRFLVRRCTALG
jgi:hypothetical protein